MQCNAVLCSVVHYSDNNKVPLGARAMVLVLVVGEQLGNVLAACCDPLCDYSDDSPPKYSSTFVTIYGNTCTLAFLGGLHRDAFFKAKCTGHCAKGTVHNAHNTVHSAWQRAEAALHLCT